MSVILRKHIMEPNHKHPIYFKALREAYQSLKMNYYSDRLTIQIFTSRMNVVIDKMAKEYFKRKGLQAIKDYVEVSCQFSRIRSLNRLFVLLCRKAQKSREESFRAIHHMSLIRRSNKLMSIWESSVKMQNIISRIRRRQSYAYFFTQVHKIHQHYVNSFELII